MPINVAGMLRVKNEARWIAEVLASMRPLCSSIDVLDDHSTDETAAIAIAAGARVHSSPFDELDEKRDKDYLLELVMRNDPRPDWVLLIDGDEVLEAAGQGAIWRAIASRQARAYSLQVLYLWNDPETIRTDGIYRSFYRPSLFQTAGSCLRFQQTSNGGNFHCSSVPACIVGMHERCDARLKHYGYMEREDRLRKYAWYNLKDPGNRAEDGYRHMVLGDVDELPATMKTKHAGPLLLEPYKPAILS